jgi:phosphotransferase system HPr (HPr) family protein
VKRKEGALENQVCETTVEIKNSNGLHMRPAMMFVDLASQFDCAITVRTDKGDADATSILAMSTLAATCGTRLTIKAEGPEAEKAVEALRELVEDVLPREELSEKE